MIKTFFNKYFAEIVITGLVIAIGLHFYNPIKNLFHAEPQIPQRIEDTSQFKALQQERDKWRDSTIFYKEQRDVLMNDYMKAMNQLTDINTRTNTHIIEYRNATPEHRKNIINDKVAIMQKEMAGQEMSNREYREKRSRITLIIRIALIFFIAGVYPAISRAGMTIAQNVPDSVFNYTYEMMVGSRDSVKILLDANNKLLRVDSADQKSLKYFTAQINDLDSEIDMFKNSEVKKESPFLSWDGFYINFIPAYVLILLIYLTRL